MDHPNQGGDKDEQFPALPGQDEENFFEGLESLFEVDDTPHSLCDVAGHVAPTGSLDELNLGNFGDPQAWNFGNQSIAGAEQPAYNENQNLSSHDKELNEQQCDQLIAETLKLLRPPTVPLGPDQFSPLPASRTQLPANQMPPGIEPFIQEQLDPAAKKELEKRERKRAIDRGYRQREKEKKQKLMDENQEKDQQLNILRAEIQTLTDQLRKAEQQLEKIAKAEAKKEVWKEQYHAWNFGNQSVAGTEQPAYNENQTLSSHDKELKEQQCDQLHAEALEIVHCPTMPLGPPAAAYSIDQFSLLPASRTQLLENQVPPGIQPLIQEQLDPAAKKELKKRERKRGIDLAYCQKKKEKKQKLMDENQEKDQQLNILRAEIQTLTDQLRKAEQQLEKIAKAEAKKEVWKEQYHAWNFGNQSVAGTEQPAYNENQTLSSHDKELKEQQCDQLLADALEIVHRPTMPLGPPDASYSVDQFSPLPASRTQLPENQMPAGIQPLIQEQLDSAAKKEPEKLERKRASDRQYQKRKKKKVEELENKSRELEIANQVKDQLLKALKAQMEDQLQKVEQQLEKIANAEAEKEVSKKQYHALNEKFEETCQKLEAMEKQIKDLGKLCIEKPKKKLKEPVMTAETSEETENDN